MKAVLSLLTAIVFISCTHNTVNEEPRHPASEPHESHHHLSEKDQQAMAKMIASQEERPLEQLLRAARIAQSLATSFDERLNSLQTQTDANLLMSSRLYCRILEMRSVQERVDEKIRYAYESSRDNALSRQWFLKKIARFSQEGPKSEAAMIQLLRLIRPQEDRVCGASGCLVKELSGYKFNVDPFDDEAFAAFIKKYRQQIATYAATRASDLDPGTCFGETRLPSQASAESYDWKNRNWVGSVLAEGSFAITYDDGPDERYTRAIRDVWAKAGLAKPAFFWLGKQVKKHPDIIQEFHAQGYLIGSHSYNHPDMANLINSRSFADFNTTNKELFRSVIPTVSHFKTWQAQQIELEVVGSLKEIETLTGQRVQYFRLPYGSGLRNPTLSTYFQRLDLEHFFWRVDSLDWQDKNPVSIMDRVLKQMKLVKKGIILFHDIHPQSVRASELLAQHFKANPQLKTVTLKQIPGLEN